MQAVKTFTSSIKARGQLTIPKQLRTLSHLEEGQMVSIIPVGDAVLIAPRRIELEEARRQVRRLLRESGLSSEDLLAGLADERETLYKEVYGKKKR
ncbi:MAG: AbrB/MazE/SpoVT family DNA-binding domain-containing protein [Deltaproteobacteria bacterium]|nr:AbrB/MazE/SpoVT family DNA-binding domain-containing protein [Deltaproteobacteria bacterium]